ncbi:ClpP/crotonase-like domain-containing protein [Paraphoma chrysanthemicola]|uniref:ClpP/crotonase-like domain-containing protein n=1 Tax=Paraphoma chrysanthemicola TaxID=798071 RepID=A0A8K0QT44_9PLEO|nr:ClpP/crotonase-like domain-containing protein [Paraphoma chrysanthemicola]
MSTVKPQTTPPPTEHVLLSYPADYVLLVTINRERQMNSIPYAGHLEMGLVFDWFDREPNLRVAIITGAGKKSFCAGQDLIELGNIRSGKSKVSPGLMRHPVSGFAGLSRRAGKKPVIAAVNGFALGGGFEIVLGCDLVVAAPGATFGLPEALRGIFAGAGGPPRLVRIVGLPVASEIALTGKPITAQRAKELNLVNRISPSQDTVVAEALKLANEIAQISPDAAIVTRAALKEGLETASVERATQLTLERYNDALQFGENALEGLSAFAQKRKPNWKPSKL